MMVDFSHLYNVPGFAIPFLLELMMVKQRMKPGCRLTILMVDIERVTHFITSLDLNYFIYFRKRTPDSFLQYSPELRNQFCRQDRAYVYVSRTQVNARNLFLLELKRDYFSLGKALGYPECCIEFATRNDEVWAHPSTGEKHQTNLVLSALQQSHSFDFRCNNFAAASSLGDIYPLNIFSHYPCNYTCQSTIDYANETMFLVKLEFPSYFDTLVHLLTHNIIFYTANHQENSNEFNAIAVKAEEFDITTRELKGIQSAFNIDSELFNDEMLLDGLTAICFKKEATLLYFKNKTHVLSGFPTDIIWIDWKFKVISLL